VDKLYFGPPTAQDCCAFTYKKPGYRCPNPISFYIKIPDGRGDDWRKAWAACADHLATVIWNMQQSYADEDSLYGGEYQLRAEELL
jgi:hypothetical protein